MFCSSGPNLVILAWMGDKLSRGQASDYRTHRRTNRQTQATTIPEGQNWPWVKTRTPAFWGYPPLPLDYPYYWFILDPKSKQDKAKATNLPKLDFFLNFEKTTLHTTHILKLFDKMCEYDWRYRADTILSTDREMDKVKPVYPPFHGGGK